MTEQAPSIPIWENVSALRTPKQDVFRQMIMHTAEQCAPLEARLMMLAENPEQADWSSLTRIVGLIEQAYVLTVESIKQ
jgi:hypothetical protein|tara:strand:+ start:233 stop:469 length:237 start_codon:yes stop_codon:yes gene_type:complete